MIWFGWVLWHINHCRLFNAKSSLYIYIKYIWFGLVGLSFMEYQSLWVFLMPNPIYTYILNIYDLVWLGWVLWHINYFRLFNAKSSLYIRNRFETLQEKTEKVTPNDEYENFVEAHLEAASKCIPTKPRTKYRVLWETSEVREKRALVKTASKSYRKNPTNTNARKLEKAQYQLAGIYLKEQAEYIQNQIDKIRDSVEDRQSRIAWQTINEVSRRKSKIESCKPTRKSKTVGTAFQKSTRKPTENNGWTDHQNYQ